MKVSIYRVVWQLLNILFVFTFVSACGGGGGGGSDPSVLNEQEQEQVTNETQSINQTDTESDTSPGTTIPETEQIDNSGVTGVVGDEGVSSVDNTTTEQFPLSENISDSPELNIKIWSSIDSVTGIQPFSYDINADGTIGGIGRLNQDDVLFVGGLDSYTPIIRTGDSLPGDRPNTIVAEFDNEKTHLGPGGNVVSVVRLEGAQPGFSLISASENGVKVIAKSGDEITPSNGQSFEVDFFVDTAVDQNGDVLFSVKGPQLNDRILLHSSDSLFTIIAESGTGYLDAEAKPKTVSNGCDISFSTNNIGFSATGPSTFPSGIMMNDGTILFSAALGGTSCRPGSQMISFRDGAYETLDARIDEVLDVVGRKSRFLSLLGITADNRLLLSGEAYSDVFSVPSVDVVWDLSFGKTAQLLFLEGESVQSPDEQYVIDATDFNGLIRNDISFNTTGQYSLQIQLENEESIFVGLPRSELAYSDLGLVGESSFEYRVGTAVLLPSPYTEDEFFYSIEPLSVLNNGTLLFYGYVANAATDTASVTPGLWMADSEGVLTQLVSPGKELPVANSVNKFISDFIGQSQTSTLLNSGEILFRVTGAGGADFIISIST